MKQSASIQCKFAFLPFLACLLFCHACTTVVPEKTEAKAPSFDGGAQNSGFEGWTTNTQTGAVYATLTSHARDRYNALIQAYGKRFAPPLVKDAGLIPTATGWQIDLQHLANFATMNRWKKEAVKP